MSENSQNGFFSSVLKGVLTALIVCLLGILIFAFIIKFAMLNTVVIKSVNQFIKVLSVFLGCVFCVKGGAGLIKGVLIGAISTALTFLLFSLFGVQVSFGLTFIIELLFGVVAGGISGIIAVNIKRR